MMARLVTPASAAIARSTSQLAGDLTWNSETFAQNPNANAIRWGTMYNFRFDADQPPVDVNATVGFFKNGEPIEVMSRARREADADAYIHADNDADEHGDGNTDEHGDGNTDRYAISIIQAAC